MTKRTFTDEQILRVREFAAANYPTTIVALLDMLATEFAVFAEGGQIEWLVKSRRIRLGHHASPIRSRPDIIARVRECVINDRASNAALVVMVRTEFGLHVTEGQVAGAVGREGLSRDGKAIRRKNHEIAAAAGLIPQPKPAAVPYAMGAVAAPEKPVEAPVALPVVKPPAPIIVALPRMPRPAPALSRPIAGPRTCQWPTGGNETWGSITFACTDVLHPGRPYCLDHCRTAYQGFDPHRFSGQLTAH